MAPHSSTLAWKIPWTGEPGRLPNNSVSEGLPSGSVVKNQPAMQETQIQPQVRKIPRRRKRQPTPVFLLGKTPWTEEPGGLASKK